MKKITLFFAILLLFGGLNADYYQSITDENQEALLIALRSLISTNSYSNYSGAKVFLFQELDKVGSTVRCIYTGEDFPISNSYSGQTSPNTEHSYAQSWFSNPESSIKKADLHHLFVCNAQVNSARGNLPFGVAASPAVANVYYSYTPWQSLRGYNNWQNMVFEPADASKGDIARALLYFHVRYSDSLYQQNVDMIPTFRLWHQADPPTPADLQRNEAIYGFQDNRNPFIDHPEYVERIWGAVSNEDWVQSASPTLRIDNIYPNPFDTELKVIVDSKENRPVKAEIFNIKGELVYTDSIGVSQNRWQWNGFSTAGERAAAGIYFLRLSDGESSVHSKVLKIK